MVLKKLVDPEAHIFLSSDRGKRFPLVSRPSPRSSESAAVVSPPLSPVFGLNGPGTPVGGLTGVKLASKRFLVINNEARMWRPHR